MAKLQPTEGTHNAMTADPQLLAVSLLADTKGYLTAARTLARGPTISLPFYFLLCHAIELILKSYLASLGATEKELRQIGHRLLRAYGRARKKGFVPTDERIPEIIRWMAPFHEDLFFRYRGTRSGSITLPVADELASVVPTLVKQIEPTVRRRFKETR